VPPTALWRLESRGDQCTWTYKDRTLVTDGLKRFVLESQSDAASFAFTAIGPRAPLPTPAGPDRFLNFAAPAIVQMTGGLGVCWESTFTDASKNDGQKFRASSPTR